MKDVKRLAPLDISTCLEEFRTLEPGWLEGQGSALLPDGLDWLSKTFDRHYPDAAPLPHTYPTPEGGVRMEWSHRANAMILEIDLSTHMGEWLWFDRNSDAEMERTLNLDDADAWAWLVSEIRAKAATPA